MGIMPEGAHTARALRLRARSFQSHRASARRMTESARRCAVPSVGSRGYALASSTMRVRDSVSVSLLVLFSSVRKAHIFSFVKERTHAFLYRKKSIKRTASVPLDRSCGRQRFDGGYERRRPRSRGSRDPSIAAPVLNIVPRGAHTALALCLRARSFQSHRASARRVVACASFASTATPSSRGYELSGRKMEFEAAASTTLFVVFSSVRKRHIFLFFMLAILLFCPILYIINLL